VIYWSKIFGFFSNDKHVEHLKKVILDTHSALLVYEESWIVQWFIHWGACRNDNDHDCKKEIYAFYVHSNYQNIGIGTILFNDFVEIYGNFPVCLWILPNSNWEFFIKKWD